MSSIGSVSNVIVPTNPIVGSPNVSDASSPSSSSGTVTPPIYTTLPFERLTLSSLGLGNPQNSDDYSAVIADLQGKLDEAGKAQRDARINESATSATAVLEAIVALKKEIATDIGNIAAAQTQQGIDQQNETTYLNNYNTDVAVIGPASVPGSALANANSTLKADSDKLSKDPMYIIVNKKSVLNPTYISDLALVNQDKARVSALQYQYQATQDYKSAVDAGYSGDTTGAAQYQSAVSSDLANARTTLQNAGLGTTTGYEGTVTQAQSDYDSYNSARVDYDQQTAIINANQTQVANDTVTIAYLLASLAAGPQIVDATANAQDLISDLNRDRRTAKIDDLVTDFSARMAAVVDRVALLSLLQSKAATEDAEASGGGQPSGGATISTAAKAALATLLTAVSDVVTALADTVAVGRFSPEAALINNQRVTIPG